MLSIRLPQGSADITGNSIDNNYNNYLAGGNLVRINNKLYYIYLNNEISYGVIEISKDGSRRIFWEGVYLSALNFLYRIRPYSGELIMGSSDNEITYYALDTNAFEEYKPFKAIPEMTLCFQETDLGLVYESKVEPGCNGSLCLYDRNTMKVIVEENVEAFYVDGNDIYYYIPNQLHDSGEIRKYCTVDKTDIAVCELNGYISLYSFMIENNYLIFGARRVDDANNPDYSIFKINLHSEDKEVEVLYRGDDSVSDYQYDICGWNAYNGTIYVASHSGLSAFDVSTNERHDLYDRYVEDCYIVDDTWVYFVDRKAVLWRVPQSGGSAERVWG